MATSDSSADQTEECSNAWEAVTGVAMESCDGEAQVKRVLARQLGIDADVDCRTATGGGLTEATCEDSVATREWVACRAAEIVVEEDVSILDALDEAWGECRDGCQDFGIEV